MSQSLKLIRLVQNSIAAARSAIASRVGQMYDTNRDVYKILGYKKTLKYDDFSAMYERQDVAGRIVDMPAQETWRNPPRLAPKNEGMSEDEFFIQFDGFVDRTSFWRWCEKVDRLSGIGRYGVIFIGLSDVAGEDLSRPVPMPDENGEGGITLDDVVYLGAYSEKRAKILSLDLEHTSPRFGQPKEYEIRLAEFTDPEGIARRSKPGEGAGVVTKNVHWSRVIHVAEDALSDVVYGRPRLQRCFDRMWDLLKISGGSSEMFWQNVAQIFHLNLDPELEYDDDDLSDLDDKMLEMLQGLRRVIQTEGIEEINTLQGGTPDPRGVFSVLRALISAGAEIPQRILFGSEQGEMASTQDKSEWYGRISARRQRHAEPEILMATIKRLAMWGALVLPEGGIRAIWPPLAEQTPMERAGTARHMAMAASKYDAEQPDRVIAVSEIREAAGLPKHLPEDTPKLPAPNDEDDEGGNSPRLAVAELHN